MDRSRLAAQLRAVPVRRRIITALDVPSGREAASLAATLGRGELFVKVGLELFSAAGPEVVEHLRAAHRRVFLDLKYHDIPNTVAAAARVAADLGAAMCTVHAAAGRGALTAAAAALAEAGGDGGRPALLAVTVLTSLAEAELQEASPSSDTLADRIERLARLAWTAAATAWSAPRRTWPGCAPPWGPSPWWSPRASAPRAPATDDQHRVATPRAALDAGADFLVVGRPITRAEDPAAALAAIADELEPSGGSDR